MLTDDEKAEKASLRYLELGQAVRNDIAEVLYAAAWLAIRMGKTSTSSVHESILMVLCGWSRFGMFRELVRAEGSN